MLFFSSFLDVLIDYSLKNKKEDIKKLLLWIKTILNIPLKTIKYDLIHNNRKDINGFISKIYNIFEQNFQTLK